MTTHHPQIGYPENRPALRAVAEIPLSWRVTGHARAILMALAIDSFDGRTCAPPRDAIMAMSGTYASQYGPALRSLTEPHRITRSDGGTFTRPALVRVTRPTRYNEYELLFVGPHGQFIDPLQSRDSTTVNDTATESGIHDSDAVATESGIHDGDNTATESRARVALQSRETPTTPFLSRLEGREGRTGEPPMPDGIDAPPDPRDIDVISKALTTNPGWAGQQWTSEEPRLADALRQAHQLGRATEEHLTRALASIPAPTATRPVGRSRLIATHLTRELIELNPDAIITQPGTPLDASQLDARDQWMAAASLSDQDRTTAIDLFDALASHLTELGWGAYDGGHQLTVETPLAWLSWDRGTDDGTPYTDVTFQLAFSHSDEFPGHLEDHWDALAAALHTECATTTAAQWNEDPNHFALKKPPAFKCAAPADTTAAFLHALATTAKLHTAAQAMANPPLLDQTTPTPDGGCQHHGWDDPGNACRGCADARGRRDTQEADTQRQKAAQEAQDRIDRQLQERQAHEEAIASGAFGGPPPDVAAALYRHPRHDQEATA